LFVEELVGVALVHEDGAAVREGLLPDELAGVVLTPRFPVFAEVAGERLLSPRYAGWR
jgi:hypothetical protein